MRYYLFFILLFGIAVANAQDVIGPVYGGTGNEIGTALCRTPTDGYLLVGSTRSFGEGSEDIYLINIDKNFGTIWEKTIGWVHSDRINSVIATNNAYILCGGIWDFGMAGMDISLIKTDLNGDVLWKKFYGSHLRDWGKKVIQTQDSDLVVLGYSRAYDNRGDIVVLKTDKEGNELWRHNYGFDYDDYGFDITFDEENNIYVIGTKNGFYDDVHANFQNHDADYFLLKINSSGEEIWRKVFGGDGHDFGSAIVVNDGKIICVGSSQSGSAGNFDLEITILNNDTIIESSSKYGGSEYDCGTSIVSNGENETFVLGTTKSYSANSSADFFLLKFNSSNSLVWQTSFGGPGNDFGMNLLATDDGGCLVIGKSNSYSNGDNDILLVKINSNGIVEDILNDIDSNERGKSGIIYPNPIADKGRIKVIDEQTSYKLVIFSINGVFKRDIDITPPYFGFDIKYLEPGTYAYELLPKGNNAEIKRISGILIVK
ncbi:MAG: hypothetical protein GXO88_02310 [Chlorobi bacterium]|nr:hypothetical protein [Chlorobiota bacterium]